MKQSTVRPLAYNGVQSGIRIHRLQPQTMTNGNESDNVPDRLTKGTLIDDDLPSHHNEPSEQFASYFDICSYGVTIAEPEYRDTTFTIHPEGVPYHGTVTIDFFDGRPEVHLYTPGEEEVQYVFGLPTKDDPHLRLIKTPYKYFKDVRENIEDGYYESNGTTEEE